MAEDYRKESREALEQAAEATEKVIFCAAIFAIVFAIIVII